MQSFNNIVQKVRDHMKKHKITYPDDVKLLAMARVILIQSCIAVVVYQQNNDIVKWWYGEIVIWWYGEVLKW